MDPTRDNPLIRFATFWWGLGIFLVFALVLAGVWLFNRQPVDSMEDVAAKVRYETKARIAQAQAASLPQAAIDAAMSAVAEKLAASKPAAVEKPEQVVPGSPTAAKIAPAAPVSPAPAVKEAVPPGAPASPQKEAPTTPVGPEKEPLKP